MTERQIYAALGAATSLYAVALDVYRRQLADLEWAEVVVGTSMCLAAAGAVVRYQKQPTWHDYERACWTAFVVGGTPIVAWQLWRTAARHWREHQGEIERLMRGVEHAKQQPASKALASLRGAGPRANGNDRERRS